MTVIRKMKNYNQYEMCIRDRPISVCQRYFAGIENVPVGVALLTPTEQANALTGLVSVSYTHLLTYNSKRICKRI